MKEKPKTSVGNRWLHVLVPLLFCVWLGVPASAGAATLKECIQTALASNPDIQAALAHIDAARFMTGKARSAHYPRLSVRGGYSATNNPTQAFMMTLNQRELDMASPAFDPNEPDDTDNVRLSLDMQYRLYNKGVDAIRVRMAETGREARELQLSAVRNALIYQVIRGYYALLQAQSFVGVQTASINSLEENLRVAQARYRAGSAVKTDVLNLEVKLAQAREDLIRAENSVKIAIASLNTIIGTPLVSTDGIPVPVQEDIQPPVLEKSEHSIENRPELKAARKAAFLKEQAYKRERRSVHPTLNAFGSYDFDSGDFNDFEDSYLVGMLAEWDIFAGFQRQNGIQAARADWEAARRETVKMENALRLDLHQACLGADEAWQRLQVTKKSVESAREALRITRVQYKEGAADITVLLTAEVGLTAQQTRDVAAYYDYVTAVANVQRAQGGLVAQYAP